MDYETINNRKSNRNANNLYTIAKFCDNSRTLDQEQDMLQKFKTDFLKYLKNFGSEKRQNLCSEYI